MVHRRGGAAKSVVRDARRRQRENRKENRKNGEPLYDQIWCVFDAENPDHNPGIFDAIKEANKAEFKVALSVPCFEYWILLHHRFDRRPYRDCSQVLHSLKAIDPNYTKGTIDFSSLESAVNEAITRSRQRLQKQGIDENTPCCTTELSLPSATRVHLLVEKLINLGKNYLPY